MHRTKDNQPIADLSRRRGRQRGVLKKSPRSWIGQWWEPILTPTGHREWKAKKRVLCPATMTETEAQRIFNEAILDQLESYSRYPQTMATLHEFWKQKFEATLKYKKRTGRAHYYYVYEKHIQPILGGQRMRDIQLEVVQQLIDAKYEAKYSPQTLCHIRNVISRMFRYAKQLKWYSGDLPTTGLSLPELTSAERIALTKEQFMTLLEALPSPSREMVFCLGMMGLRISELVGLKWKRLNLTDQTAVVDGTAIPPFTAAIREQFVRVGRRQKVDPITKEKSVADPEETYGAYQTLKKAAVRKDTSASEVNPCAETRS